MGHIWITDRRGDSDGGVGGGIERLVRGRPVRDLICFTIMYYKARKMVNGILDTLMIYEKESESTIKGWYIVQVREGR